jgi:hypothetical protein
VTKRVFAAVLTKQEPEVDINDGWSSKAIRPRVEKSERPRGHDGVSEKTKLEVDPMHKLLHPTIEAMEVLDKAAGKYTFEPCPAIRVSNERPEKVAETPTPSALYEDNGSTLLKNSLKWMTESGFPLENNEKTT